MATTITALTGTPQTLTLAAGAALKNVGSSTLELTATPGSRPVRLDEARGLTIPTPAPASVTVRAADDPAGGWLRVDSPVTSAGDPVLPY